MGNELQTRLDAWLARLNGPGYIGREDRDRVVAEMRAEGPERLFPLLAAMLASQDPEIRCVSCETVFRIDPIRALELVLPLLNDSEMAVRWHACGCLHDFGDERAVGPLSKVLKEDPDAQVRGTAAYALGGIAS